MRNKLSADDPLGDRALTDMQAVWDHFVDDDAATLPDVEGQHPPGTGVQHGAAHGCTHELSLEQFDKVLTTVPDEKWAELFEPVPAPTYNSGGRLGPMLSTATGTATRLSKTMYAFLGAYPFVTLFFGIDFGGEGIFNKFGCNRGFLGGDADTTVATCTAEAAADTMEVIVHLGLFVGLLGGLAAFHGLRVAHRPAAAGGVLALLQAASPGLSVLATRALQRRAKVAKTLYGGLITLVLLVLPVFLFLAPIGKALIIALYLLNIVLGLASTLYWALSLRLAAALAAARLEAVAAAVRAAGAQTALLDATAWRETIEAPAVDLARRVLPLFSRGWGLWLVAVAAGHVG